MSTKSKETKIESLRANMRKGTFVIIKARTNAHYQSIVSVFTNRRYWNDEFIYLAEQINELSDEDFAVELVRAKKKIGNSLKAKVETK
jgi:hypothetical protein